MLIHQQMSTTPVSRSRSFVALTLPGAVITVVLVYLGITPLAALLGTAMWVAQGATGAWVIERITNRASLQHGLFFVLGPGALLGIGFTVALYLLARGGLPGLIVALGWNAAGAVAWCRGDARRDPIDHQSTLSSLCVLIGCVLFANSKEFPNLLLPGVALLLLVVTWPILPSLLARSSAVVVSLTFLVMSAAERSSYWWSASDDTTTLSAIGNMIVQRGRVADTAGWATGSHHWLLHAWLALWNHVAGGRIFETYLIVWPMVAALSMFASLWLLLELFTGKQLDYRRFAVVAVMTAGLVRLEWPAPQEQQPFLFAMGACAAWWVRSRRSSERCRFAALGAGLAVVFVVVPAMLFVLKPSLLVAWGLLIVGAGLARVVSFTRWGLVTSIALSCIAVAGGLMAMSVGSSWISDRSFTSFGIEFLPDDLGWCQQSSAGQTTICVLSLQVVLGVAMLVSLVVLWLRRDLLNRDVSLVVLMPLVLAYVPLRLFVSSGVGSGAPSFYRLSEMAIMLVVASALTVVVLTRSINVRSGVLVILGVSLAVFASRESDVMSDAVGSTLIKVSTLRYLSSTDVIAVGLALLTGLLVALISGKRDGLKNVALLCCSAVCLVPVARLASESAVAETPVTRTSRPDFFGSNDIEEVAQWLHNKTTFGTLMATNYLCSDDRLAECTRTTPSFECQQPTPVLMAGWALSALSEREFLYLSQGWDTRSDYCMLHEVSTRLSRDVSIDAVTALESRGVDYFVASRKHTGSRSWLVLRQSAVLITEHFAVVRLSDLRNVAST